MLKSIQWPPRPTTIWPLLSLWPHPLLLSPAVTLLQTYWLPCCSSSISGICLTQGPSQAVLSAWNILSPDICTSNSLTSFKFLFRYHLFKETYSDHHVLLHLPFPYFPFRFPDLHFSDSTYHILKHFTIYLLMFVCLPQLKYINSIRQDFCLYSMISLISYTNTWNTVSIQ